MEVRGSVALITGSSRGIGEAIAMLLAKERAPLALDSRKSVAEIEAVAEQIRREGCRASIFMGDVANFGNCLRLGPHDNHSGLLVVNASSGAKIRLYFALEWVFEATVGKSMLKLVVLDKDGNRCSLGASLKRNLFRFMDWPPALHLAVALAIAASSDRQRIGDFIRHTVVTETSEKDINPPPAPFLFH